MAKLASEAVRSNIKLLVQRICNTVLCLITFVTNAYGRIGRKGCGLNTYQTNPDMANDW